MRVYNEYKTIVKQLLKPTKLATKMKIHLRQRKQSKTGRVSLYLEFYKSTKTKDGKTKPVREYEYLDLYLIDKPKNPFDKQTNKETLRLAESIKAKRELEIKNGEYCLVLK